MMRSILSVSALSVSALSVSVLALSLLALTAIPAAAQLPAAAGASDYKIGPVDTAHGDREFHLLWPEGAPEALGTELLDKPKITVYRAPAGKANGAAVVVCPGGGYVVVASDHEGKQVAEWLNGLGVTAFVLQYRLGPRYQHPAPLQDAQRAIRLVRARATEWGVDPSRVGILGFSAGGHLASTAGTHFDDGKPDASDPVERKGSRPDFLVLGYPVISLTHPSVHKGSRDNLLGKDADPKLLESLSNETQVTPRTPPTFLFHTNEDTAVPPEHAILFYEALRRASVPAEMHIFAKGPHGVGLAPKDQALSLWPRLCAAWMDTMGLLSRKGLAAAQAAPITYWDVPRKGANLFDERETPERLQAAAREGIAFVRLAPNKWPTTARDFLLGDADAYRGLIPADLERLRATLREADAAGLKVVLTTLSLPGARWAQQNGGERDRRLWTDDRWLSQAEAFWRDLASALRGSPGLAAYNPLNEPYPERAAPGFEKMGPARWDESVRGGPADLNRFNARLVRAIRSADPATPVLLDAGLFADPGRFESLLPVDDPAVLYAFHMYEPFTYTNRKRNGGRFAYPGPVPDDAPGGRKRSWDAAALDAYLEPVRSWQARHAVPRSRIMAAEFGCHRLSRGADRYLDDLVRIFDRSGWHWAFYAFREDTWDGMDYEKGPRPLFPILRRALAGSLTPAASQ